MLWYDVDGEFSTLVLSCCVWHKHDHQFLCTWEMGGWCAPNLWACIADTIWSCQKKSERCWSIDGFSGVWRAFILCTTAQKFFIWLKQICKCNYLVDHSAVLAKTAYRFSHQWYQYIYLMLNSVICTRMMILNFAILCKQFLFCDLSCTLRWFFWTINCQQNYERYVVRQKRAEGKKALKDYLLYGKSSPHLQVKFLLHFCHLNCFPSSFFLGLSTCFLSSKGSLRQQCVYARM